MAGKRTRQVVKIGDSCSFEERPDGTWFVAFPHMDVEATGASKDEAWGALLEVLGEKIQSSDEAAERWQEFAKANVVEEEMTDEEVAAETERKASIKEQSHAASAAFAVVTNDTLDAAIAGETPVLVDFWAEWCMPCHMMAPVLKEAADELGDRLKVAKINVDENEGNWERFGIRGIPTLILFAKGEELHRIVGAGRSKQQLIAEIEPHL